MLKEIFHNEFRPEFQYLIEKSLEYDAKQLILMGNFYFKNSPYLLVPDKIMNHEDTVFVMSESLLVFFSYYYEHEKNTNNVDYRNNVLENIVVTKTSFEFNAPIQKKIDENIFSMQLLASRIDSKERLWFNLLLNMSDNKHLCHLEGCILSHDIHKGETKPHS